MKINNYIEHTILKPDCTNKDIEKLVQEAIQYNFFGICINPCYITYAKELLKDSPVKLVTVVNFPLASNSISMTLHQTDLSLKMGADEIDTVLNIAEMKNQNYKKVFEDIKQTKSVCCDNNLKVILETDLLTKEEIACASKIAADAGANFIKTSTGFVKNGIGATVENVEIMHSAISGYDVQIKASGGIKDFNKAKALIEAGAVRLGTSSGVEIMLGEEQNV